MPQFLALEPRTLFSTFTVLNLNDSGPGSLRAQIAAADATHSADSIGFAPGLAGTIKLTSGELLIAGSVSIDGPGANVLAVSGNGASRVFEVESGFDVAIDGLTISHGYAPDTGGGILNDGSTLTLSGDQLTKNVAYESAGTGDPGGGFGGGLDSLGGTLTIDGCQITDNQAIGAAKASAPGNGIGGGINVKAGTVTISHSTIAGNLALGGAGSEEGEASGGGIGTAVGLVINNSTISGNRAVGADNAVYDDGVGGGITTSGPTTISECTFDENAALGGNGGTGAYVGEAEGAAIAVYGPVAGYLAGTTKISDSTFEYNQAIAGNDGNSGPGQVDPGVDESYGTIDNVFGDGLSVAGSSFSHNRSVGGNNATATGSDIVEVGVAEGGAICNELGSAATIRSTTFNDNQAIGGNNDKGTGPVVHVGTGFGAGIFNGFGGNGAKVGSLMLPAPVGANPLTVTNSLFEQNTAQGGNDNSATASVEGLSGVGVGGGVMNYLGGSADISATVLIDNLAAGGTGNTVTDDSTVKGGGVVFAGIGAGGGNFNALSNYDSTGYGQFDPSTLTVTNGFIGFNTAKGSPGSAGLGGGVYSDATASLSLASSLVSSNLATGIPGTGGGVDALGKFTDTLTSIVDNHASAADSDLDT